MKEARQKYFRDLLEQALTSLEAENALGADGTKIVELDQQSIGRLSRMDALQHQAMAQATQARRALSAPRIQAALARMEDGEYGICPDCGEDIPEGRLELDPTTPLCISCASG